MPLAGLFLISAMIALAQLPDGPSAHVQWPLAWPDPPAGTPSDPASAAIADPGPAAPGFAPAQRTAAQTPASVVPDDAIGGSNVSAAVALLDLGRDLQADGGGIAPGWPADLDLPTDALAGVLTVQMKSMPSGGTAYVAPRHAKPARWAGCPFSTAHACAMWHHAGR